MAKLHFRYGVMGGSKTADALMLAYNFREKGKIPLLAKPIHEPRRCGPASVSRRSAYR